MSRLSRVKPNRCNHCSYAPSRASAQKIHIRRHWNVNPHDNLEQSEIYPWFFVIFLCHCWPFIDLWEVCKIFFNFLPTFCKYSFGEANISKNCNFVKIIIKTVNHKLICYSKKKNIINSKMDNFELLNVNPRSFSFLCA